MNTIPAKGWYAVFRNEDGSQLRLPVEAWVFSGAWADRHGLVIWRDGPMFADEQEAFVRFEPEGGWPE